MTQAGPETCRLCTRTFSDRKCFGRHLWEEHQLTPDQYRVQVLRTGPKCCNPECTKSVPLSPSGGWHKACSPSCAIKMGVDIPHSSGEESIGEDVFCLIGLLVLLGLFGAFPAIAMLREKPNNPGGWVWGGLTLLLIICLCVRFGNVFSPILIYIFDNPWGKRLGGVIAITYFLLILAGLAWLKSLVMP